MEHGDFTPAWKITLTVRSWWRGDFWDFSISMHSFCLSGSLGVWTELSFDYANFLFSDFLNHVVNLNHCEVLLIVHISELLSSICFTMYNPCLALWICILVRKMSCSQNKLWICTLSLVSIVISVYEPGVFIHSVSQINDIPVYQTSRKIDTNKTHESCFHIFP